MEVTLNLDYYSDKYVNLANTLQNLDEKLQKNFPGIQWNYHKSTRKYNPMTVGVYGFYTIVSTIYIFQIAHCRCGWISSVIVSVCYSCVTGAPAFASFLFIGNMDMLRLRFRLIRKLLIQNIMYAHRKSGVVQKEDIEKFKKLENAFTDYFSLIVTLNQVFSVITGSGLFHDFAVITSLGYLMCWKAFDTNAKIHEYVFVVLFMTPRLYKVATTSIYGYATQKEVSLETWNYDTIMIFLLLLQRRNCCHEFIKIEYNLKKNSLICQHLETFLHWNMHNNYRITVGKILKCNLSLIFLVRFLF